MRRNVYMLMKRKLIDIPEDTFERLSAKASAKGKSLKGYIEQLLEEDSVKLNEPPVGYGYRFTYDREPTEAELMAVMEAAAIASAESRKRSEDRMFDALNTDILKNCNGR